MDGRTDVEVTFLLLASPPPAEEDGLAIFLPLSPIDDELDPRELREELEDVLLNGCDWGAARAMVIL